MWSRSHFTHQNVGLLPGDQCQAYPGRGMTNDAFTCVSPECPSTCACMC